MSVEADQSVSELIGYLPIADHIPYLNQETNLLEITMAGLKQRKLWAEDLIREGTATQSDCVSRIEQITTILEGRSNGTDS